MAEDREPRYMHAWYSQVSAELKGSSWYEADDGRYVKVTHVSNHEVLPEEVTDTTPDLNYVGLVSKFIEEAQKGQ